MNELASLAASAKENGAWYANGNDANFCFPLSELEDDTPVHLSENHEGIVWMSLVLLPENCYGAGGCVGLISFTPSVAHRVVHS
jgi:hypothetical protein